MKRVGWLKRKTPLKRGGPLKRTGWLKRKTPMKRVNRERKARVNAIQFGDQAALCRSMTCCICDAPGPSDPHHVPSRGAGGIDKDTVPLCRRCHDEFHDHGERTFRDRHGVNLREFAAELARGLA